MRILVSNDDGYSSTGITALAEALSDIADIVIVAPDRNRSGASNSLTLDVPLRVKRVREDVYSVNGTPTDCVHVAVTGLLDYEPDMVVSGINHGANLGDDVLYSGTVAAAMEGRFLGLPAIAISLVLDGGRHFDAAAEVAKATVRQLVDDPLPPNSLLSLNVPDRPLSSIKGLKASRLGFRHRAEPVVRALDPKNRPVYWVGAAGAGQDAGPGTDFHAVADGYVSVTPLTVDLTDHTSLASLNGWLAYDVPK